MTRWLTHSVLGLYRALTIGVMMPSVLIVIVFVSALVIGLGWTILRLGQKPPKFLDGDLAAEFSHPHPAIARAFSKEDLDYLLSGDRSTPETVRKFRRTRRRVTSLFLRDMRRDFHRAWSVCRQLAPVSQDPDFAVKLFKQLALFHGLYTLVRLRSLVGDPGLGCFEVLTESLGHLRGTAGELVQLSQLQGAATVP